MKEQILQTSHSSILKAKCAPDWARVAWGVALQEGAKDEDIECFSAVKKTVLTEDVITYRDWWHILWACRKLIGADFPYLIARPITHSSLGMFGYAMSYASSFYEAMTHVESWSETHEPINQFVQLRQAEDGGWYLRGEYPLSGWTRTAFSISAAKIATELYKGIVMEDYPYPVKFNCERPSNISRLMAESVFPEGVEFDQCLPAAYELRIPPDKVYAPNPRADAKRFKAALLASPPANPPWRLNLVAQVQAMQYTATHILSTDQVADRLHLSRKALVSRLKAENKTCKQIADEMAYTRYREMEPYLNKSEITRRLGFADARVLTRLIAQFESPPAKMIGST